MGTVVSSHGTGLGGDSMSRKSNKTKKLIQNAFLGLLEENAKIDRVTVSEISKRAHINRSTFYDYFDNVKDLKERLFAEVRQNLSMREIYPVIHSLAEYEESVHRFIDYVEENRALICSLVRTKLGSDLFYQLAEEEVQYRMNNVYQLSGSDKNGKRRVSISNFKVYGAVGFSINWAQGNIDISKDELVQFILEFTTLGNNADWTYHESSVNSKA